MAMLCVVIYSFNFIQFRYIDDRYRRIWVEGDFEGDDFAALEGVCHTARRLPGEVESKAGGWRMAVG